jgi:outer membrane protein OmpA-like peptidoglycan-associated protein
LRKSIVVISFFLILVVGYAFAEGETTPQADEATQSQATSQSIGVFNMGGGGSKIPPSLQPIPGTSNDVFPVNAVTGRTERKQIKPLKGEEIQYMEEVKNMAKGNKTNLVANVLLPNRWTKKQRIFSVVRKKESKKKNDGPITILNWDVEIMRHPDDEPLVYTTVVGEEWWPERRFISEGIKECRAKNHDTERIALYGFVLIASKTEASNKGIGLGGSSINGSNNIALGSTLGFSTGKLFGYSAVLPVVNLVCLNAGKTEMPLQSETKVSEPPKQTPAENKEKSQEIPVMTKSPVKSAENENDWKKMSEKLIGVLENFSKQPSLLAPQVAAQVDSCSGIPELSIYFAFDKPKKTDSSYEVDLKYWVKYVPDYENRLDQMKKWKESHSGCDVQVEGHTNSIGSHEYNGPLGRRRAIAATNLLKKHGIVVKQWVSLGEDFPVPKEIKEAFFSVSKTPTSEVDEQDRRVIIRIIGKASGM